MLLCKPAPVSDWIAAKQFQVIEHPPYSPDLVLAEFILFPKVKIELACLTLTRAGYDRQQFNESTMIFRY
jgi:hypothetical protein